MRKLTNCKNQEEIKIDIPTIKNAMEGFNSWLEEAEEIISELENMVQKQDQSEEQLEKIIKKKKKKVTEDENTTWLWEVS